MIVAACSTGTDWPEAVAICVIAVCAALAYAAWRFTGGKHYGEGRGGDDG